MNLITPNWPAPQTIRAYTTVKNTFHEKNSGNFTAKDPESLKNILSLPNEPIWITQNHTNIVVEARSDNKEQIADASFSREPNQVCVVMTADCLPILICDKTASHVAAIHAGWRGLASGIIENTINSLNIPSEQLLVWLGPAIGPEKFEVGEDVYDRFVNPMPEAKNAFKLINEKKWLADIYALAKMRLHAKGIFAIYGGNFCTYSQADLFFSYRRDKGQTGRMASLIWINK